MQITDSKQLAKAIDSLESKKAVEEDMVLKNLSVARQYFDPVYQVKSLLPRKVPLREALNAAMNESIRDAASFGFGSKPKDSFLKKARKSMLRKVALNVLSKNSGKIKAIGFAVLKNFLH